MRDVAGNSVEIYLARIVGPLDGKAGRGVRATALIEDIWCGGIWGYSYRRGGTSC
jgi:hypothetical protein